MTKICFFMICLKADLFFKHWTAQEWIGNMSENGWLQFQKQVIFIPFSCVSVFTEYLVSMCVYIHVCITYLNKIKYFINIILKN